MRRLILTVTTVLLASVLAGIVLAFAVRQGGESDRDQLLRRIAQLEEQNAEQVSDHREANQGDHDCIVALALLLADPSRDRNVEPIPPRECRAHQPPENP